jgi:hypothetical protein
VDATDSIERCVKAIADSCAGMSAEVIVVQAGRDPVVERTVESIANARLIELEPAALTARLWSEGIANANGEIVAITTAHCFVHRDWARAAVASLDGNVAGVGGPLELAEDASNVDAAIFFLRYSAFMAHPDGRATDIAGDNAAYRVSLLPVSSWTKSSGFWENDVNRKIRESGGELAWNSSMRVQFGRSFALRAICRHRYEHGRLFAIARVARGARAIGLVAKSPLVPAALVLRIGRRLSRRPDYRSRFIAAIPLIMIMAAAWAAGEAAGAIEGSRAHRR